MYRFEAPLWRHEGSAAWHFVTVPESASDDIADATMGPAPARGFGSVRVRVTIGGSTWSTSVFPDKQRGAYVLPVRKDVRRAEGVTDGDVLAVRLELIDP